MESFLIQNDFIVLFLQKYEYKSQPLNYPGQSESIENRSLRPHSEQSDMYLKWRQYREVLKFMSTL